MGTMDHVDFSLQQHLRVLRGQVDARLDQLVPAAGLPPAALHGAIRHSLLAPGKRLRPLLAMLTAAQFGARDGAALDPACAIEMVHAASLILDDLPSMDNAAMRRGRPATHVAFGEDTAILASVALLNQAFAVIARADALECEARLELVTTLSGAIGFDGLVAGQLRDLQQARQGDTASVQQVHHQKTGALFVAACETGARVAGASARQMEAARGFATELGLAFQIQDDIIDVTMSEAAAGKDVGKDVGKDTMVAVLGCERARARLDEHVAAAVAHLSAVGESGPLVRLTRGLFPARTAAA
jgi:geranylgeranyl diphosphate synthase, type II